MMSTNNSLKKSHSQEIQAAKTTTHQLPNRASSFQFPTSPQHSSSNVGERILHPSHPQPQHLLARFKDLPELFTCSGCKEYGAGNRFTCLQCSYQLHEFCALAPLALKAHPLHPRHQLLFHSKSKPVKGGILWPRCDVCGKKVKGFTFRCSACGFQMHPCCAMLSAEMSFSIHPHPLKLLPATATPPALSSGDQSLACGGDCKKKRSGRVYRCTVCSNYYLHAVCAKNLINGLEANGIKRLPEKPSMLGTAVRVASVVGEKVGEKFINGLFESVGQGVGNFLVQDMTTGKHVSTRAPS